MARYPGHLASRYTYRESPKRTVGCTADLSEYTSQDVLSRKALLNLHLPSLEMLKVFIHIPLSLSSSSAFLQAGIPLNALFHRNLGLVHLKTLENMLSFLPLMQSFTQV